MLHCTLFFVVAHIPPFKNIFQGKKYPEMNKRTESAIFQALALWKK